MMERSTQCFGAGGQRDRFTVGLEMVPSKTFGNFFDISLKLRSLCKFRGAGAAIRQTRVAERATRNPDYAGGNGAAENESART